MFSFSSAIIEQQKLGFDEKAKQKQKYTKPKENRQDPSVKGEVDDDAINKSDSVNKGTPVHHGNRVREDNRTSGAQQSLPYLRSLYCPSKEEDPNSALRIQHRDCNVLSNWENDTESVVSSAPTDDERSSQHSAVEGTLVSMAHSVVSGQTQPRPPPIVHQVLNPTHAARNPVPQVNDARQGPSNNGTLPNAGAAGRSHLPPAGQSNSFPRSTSHPQMSNRQNRANTGTGSGGSSADSGENVPPSSRWQPSGDTNTGRYRSATQGGTLRGNAQARGSTTRSLAKDLWADPVGLVTTKRAAYNEQMARTTQEREQYLRPPPSDESFPSILAPLVAVRTENKVFIECVTTTNNIQYLRISSRDGKADFTPVFDGIRRAVQHAKAREISATASYIFVPPTAEAMRGVVKPEVHQILAPMRATAFVLSGDPLSANERLAWRLGRPGMVAENQREFQTILIAGLKGLEPLKGWMRMRVTFGHVAIRNFRTPFIEGKYSFVQFVEMVKNPRQVGSFEKKIGGSETAIKLSQKIVNWPSKFVPANGRTVSLSDVKFKDTAILFIQTNTGEELRLEAEIDRFYEQEHSEFQAGSVRLFVKEKTHKSLNITFVDVERELDWQLEVITDSERIEVPSPLYDLIKKSISVDSKVLKDCHGLEYPELKTAPEKPPQYKRDFKITSVVVRSVIQYKLIDSGFFVEVSIFREWLGDRMRGEPTMKTSVSMFHPEWDTQMESIEHTTRVRDFGPGLIHLFNGQAAWLVPFLDEVAFTQGLLVDVAKAIKVEGATKAEAAATKAVADAVKTAQYVAAQTSARATGEIS
ncbi:hypothetical protein DL98DRAFT_617514 [Cadophora sp. DSE1049]|nr:hypothetical protein DL98DRAFT_617514 [Cadophora sp. DSE1049]